MKNRKHFEQKAGVLISGNSGNTSWIFGHRLSRLILENEENHCLPQSGPKPKISLSVQITF